VTDAAPAIERLPDGRMRVAGGLGFDQASEALARGQLLYEGGRGEVEVDLAGLREVDSATLAVLLAWTARAARASRRSTMLTAERSAASSKRSGSVSMRSVARRP